MATARLSRTGRHVKLQLTKLEADALEALLSRIPAPPCPATQLECVGLSTFDVWAELNNLRHESQSLPNRFPAFRMREVGLKDPHGVAPETQQETTGIE